MADGIAVRREDDFDFRSPAYAALFAASDATAFQSPLWLDHLYRSLAPSREAEPIVVTVREAGASKLLALLPMLRRRKNGVVLLEAADLGVSDYAAPVVLSAARERLSGLGAIVATALPAFDLMRVKPVPEPLLADWTLFFDARLEKLDFSAHAATLSAPYDAWRKAAFTDSFARYLDRRKKRFMKSGDVSLERLRDASEIAAAIGTIRTLRAGRFEGDPIQHEPVADFYAGVATEGAATGEALTWRLSLDDQPVGHVFGLGLKGRFLYLLIGCDYERFGRHSPGLIMYDMMMEDWCASGGEVFDFTIGDEPFKRDFATVPTAIYALSEARTWKGRLARAAFEAREQWRRRSRRKEEAGGEPAGGAS